MPAVDISNLIQTVLIYALPVLFAITVHEAAHGYAAVSYTHLTLPTTPYV